jgi:flagellar assembly protein FliH
MSEFAQKTQDDQGFVVGFPGRRDAAADAALANRDATPPAGFTPAELIARIEQAFGGGEPVGRPKHFHPQNPDADPTAGWDPLDAGQAPFVDPVDAARTTGYDEGYAAAVAAVQEKSARDDALMTGIAASIGGGAMDRAALAEQLRRTVLTLVGRVIGEAGVSGELLAKRVEAATDCLADATESAMLRVHPDDVALLEGRLPATVFAVGDAAISRGSFVMESASTVIEDGPAMWLEQLEAAIDKVALPTC